METRPPYQVPAGADIDAQIVVPVEGMVQAGHLLDVLVRLGVPTLVCGGAGVGKSTIVGERLGASEADLHTISLPL